MRIELDFLDSAEKIYQVVLRGELSRATRSVLIVTALARETRVEFQDEVVSFLRVVDSLLERGVQVFLIVAAKPSAPFMRSLVEFPRVRRQLRLRICARMHFKCILIDGKKLLAGSANLTPGGLGYRRAGKRNFEVAIWTEDQRLVREISRIAWEVWEQSPCDSCLQRRLCYLEHMRFRDALTGADASK